MNDLNLIINSYKIDRKVYFIIPEEGKIGVGKIDNVLIEAKRNNLTIFVKDYYCIGTDFQIKNDNTKIIQLNYNYVFLTEEEFIEKYYMWLEAIHLFLMNELSKKEKNIVFDNYNKNFILKLKEKIKLKIKNKRGKK